MATTMWKALAVTLASAVLLGQLGTAYAAYSDVPAGSWYRDAVDAFGEAGYLDASQNRFRPGDHANRAEFVKLIVEMQGGILQSSPAIPSFDDAKPGNWYYGYMEEAGREGWLKGDGNCYGRHPCMVRPAANINRAEAAALIVRAFGLDATGEAPRFSDNPGNTWYAQTLQTAADHCVLQGDDRTYRVRPGDFMNRAEMVVMLYRVEQGLDYNADCNRSPVTNPELTDVTAVSPTSVEAEFSVDLDRQTAERSSHYVIIGPDGRIDIDSVTMIGDDAVLIELGEELEPDEQYRLTVTDLKAKGGSLFSDTLSFRGYDERVQSDANLTVALASDTPASTTLPRGGQAVLLSLDLSASCEDDLTIDRISLSHRGFGDRSDIEGLYAMIDGKRVTRLRSIDSRNGVTDLRFSPPLTIRACKSVTLDVVADFASGATPGGEHSFSVERADDIDTDAKNVRGNLPVRGNTFRVGAVTSGTVNVEYRTVSSNTVRVGDENKVVGRFQVAANGVEDQTLYSVTLEQNGTASDGDLTNIRIRRTDGTIITRSAATTEKDLVTLKFDPPFTLREGDKVTLEVIADIKGGAARTVKMQLEEGSDLLAIGSKYGSASRGRLIGSQVTISQTSAPDTVTIDAGGLTIEIDGPAQQSFTPDDDDAVLANIRFTTAGDDVEIRSMYALILAETSTGAGLAVSGDTSSDNVHEVLRDVEIRNSSRGRTVSAVRLTGGNDFGTDANRTYQIYRFDDFVLRANETWQFRVDFTDNGRGRHPRQGDRFSVRICTEPTSVLVNGSLTGNSTGCDFGGVLNASSTAYQLRVESAATGDRIGDVRPRGTVVGNTHRIATPELTVAVQNIGDTDVTVRNAKNVNLLRFEIRANEAKDVLLTKASFEAESGSILSAQNYALWVDTDDDGVVDTTIERGRSAQGGKVTFSELAGGGYLLPGQKVTVFEVHADISSAPVSNILRLQFATSTGDYLEAEEADRGSTLSGIRTNGTCAVSVCDIVVQTTPSKLYTIAGQGNLFVTRTSESLRTRQLLGGTITEPIMRLQMRAQNEPIDVTDIQISSSGSLAQSIERLDLFRSTDASPFASATVGGCGSDDVPGDGSIRTFCAKMRNRQLVISPNQSENILVRARVKTDTDGGISGETVQFWISGEAVVNYATGSGAIRATGLNSSSTLAANNGDSVADGEVFIGTNTPGLNTAITGVTHDIVMSRIIAIENANPATGNQPVPTGTVPFAQFKFTAAQNANNRNGTNKATLSGIIFNVNATNVAIDAGTFRLYNKTTSAAKQTCTAMEYDGTPITGTASGSFLVSCTDLRNATVDTRIDSGETRTFVLEASVTNSQVGNNNSTLQGSLQQFSSRDTAQNGFGPTASHIQWADEDQTVQVFSWIDYPETVVHSSTYRN